jgi:hypothetical protein
VSVRGGRHAPQSPTEAAAFDPEMTRMADRIRIIKHEAVSNCVKA